MSVGNVVAFECEVLAASCVTARPVIIIHLLRQLAADTAHTTNTATEKIYRNTKFKNRIKLTTIYENHKCSTINHTIHENLKNTIYYILTIFHLNIPAFCCQTLKAEIHLYMYMYMYISSYLLLTYSSSNGLRTVSQHDSTGLPSIMIIYFYSASLMTSHVLILFRSVSGDLTSSPCVVHSAILMIYAFLCAIHRAPNVVILYYELADDSTSEIQSSISQK